MPYSIRPYDREKVVAYAHRWAYGRNPQYLSFNQIGGDCTNFASQCVFAGSKVMNYSKQNGWFYVSSSNRSPSWTGVGFFYNFITRNKGIGPFAVDTSVVQMMPGDVIQLSFDGVTFAHTPVIVRIDGVPSPETIFVAAHTVDADDRPVNSYAYKKIRYLHFNGVRI